MSCPHGNWDCDTCQEVDAAYDKGYKAGSDSAKATIQRVRELHVPLTYYNGDFNGCEEEWQECEICQTKYPCDTIKYLDGEQ